jgi:hypothetical protein
MAPHSLEDLSEHHASALAYFDAVLIFTVAAVVLALTLGLGIGSLRLQVSVHVK